jgi:DNA gyrase subunit A
VSEIRELGRATQGVTLIALDDGSTLSGLQRIAENDAASEADTPDGEPAAGADPSNPSDGASGTGTETP